MFAGVAIELSTQCPKCRAPLPLNGASETVLCDQCRSVMPTPPELWKTALGDAVGEAIAMEVGNGRNATMFTGHGELKLLYGRLDPRCVDEACKERFTPEALAQAASTGSIACAKCGTRAAVRRAPEWLRIVHRKVALLVGETMAAAAPSATPETVRFHCYHCGGGLPLDGKERSVKCTYCGNALVVPDEIWVRLNPARKVERWWLVLEMDLSRAAGVLPADMDRLCDVGVEPGGNLVVAWHDDDEGDVGHPCRIAVVDRDGLLLWKQTGIEFSDDARLLASPADGTLWLVDKEMGFVRQLDPRTGQPLRTLGANGAFDVKDAECVGIDWDGTFLVLRDWEGSTDALRRFAPDGSRVSTWPGQRHYSDESDIDRPEWDSLPSKPVRLPHGARFRFGWDGTFWVWDRNGTHVARYQRDGVLLGVLPLPPGYLSCIEDASAARDGTLSLLVEPKQELGDRKWPHVARVLPDGRFVLAIGPYVSPNAPAIGSYAHRLAGLPDGTLWVAGSDVDTLYGFAPDGSSFFMSEATRQQQSGWLADELTKARRGKRLVADRG